MEKEEKIPSDFFLLSTFSMLYRTENNMSFLWDHVIWEPKTVLGLYKKNATMAFAIYRHGLMLLGIESNNLIKKYIRIEIE
jgi:hypothetical protein